MEIEDRGQDYKKGDQFVIIRKPAFLISIGTPSLRRTVKKVTKVKRLDNEYKSICVHFEYLTPNNK